MSYQTICECCGHKVTAYTQTLNVGMIGALGKLIEYRRRNGYRAELGELDLNTVQYSTFQKLQYRGLTHRNSEGRAPTIIGLRFRDGMTTISETIIVMGSKQLPTTHEARKKSKKKPVCKYIREFKNYEYKQRADYQQEKGASPNLFSS